MARRYLVKNGFQLETIDVEAGTFTPARPGVTRAVTLDSVALVLANVLTGADQAADLVLLKAVWTATSTDIVQSTTKGYIQSVSPLITDLTNDRDNAVSNQSLHETSYKDVLPPRFSEAWDSLSTDDTRLSVEENRAVIKLLEGSFENIKSHGSEGEAWAAYNDFVIRGQGDEAAAEARSNYLVKA